MHPRDRTCEWCGFGPLYELHPSGVQFRSHPCPGKPPATPEDGAAIAFGLMGMAWELYYLLACPWCTGIRSDKDAPCECGFEGSEKRSDP